VRVALGGSTPERVPRATRVRIGAAFVAITMVTLLGALASGIAVVATSCAFFVAGFLVTQPVLMRRRSGQVVVGIGPRPIVVLAALAVLAWVTGGNDFIGSGGLAFASGGMCRWFVASTSARWRIDRLHD
jgi:hypothetical protein